LDSWGHALDQKYFRSGFLAVLQQQQCQWHAINAHAAVVVLLVVWSGLMWVYS
jgi:hypothetical protein